MLRGIKTGSLLVIVVTLLGMMNLSERATDSLRGGFLACILPLSSGVVHGQQKISGFFLAIGGLFSDSAKKQKLEDSQEVERLHLENVRLNQEIGILQEALRQQGLQRLLPERQEPIPARVVYRSFALWDSTLWVDVGEKDNVAHNSPVLVGASLVGVVDYVGTKWSRVRLLSDALMMPSVRAVRGGVQNQALMSHVDALNDALLVRGDMGTLRELLGRYKKLLETTSETLFLAKGELQGCCVKAWRGGGQVLTGSGFNYDFADAQGPARDLRSGVPTTGGEGCPLVKVNDLLVTTGLDGVFPSGLHVAYVSSLDVLREGAYCYDLEAIPTAGNLDELSVVFILPPQDNLSGVR